MFIAQVYAYWFSNKDRRTIRYLVLFMLYVSFGIFAWHAPTCVDSVLETVHTAMCLHVLYVYFVIEAGSDDVGQYFIW